MLLTPQAVAQKQAQTFLNDSEFRALCNPVISADGAWVAAEERSCQGDGNVRVWSTKGDVTFNIKQGQNPRISRDSRWVGVLQKQPLADSKTASPKNRRAGQTLVLLDLHAGSRRTFEFVLSYDVTYIALTPRQVVPLKNASPISFVFSITASVRLSCSMSLASLSGSKNRTNPWLS